MTTLYLCMALSFACFLLEARWAPIGFAVLGGVAYTYLT